MDNLARDVLEAKRLGYGCHYGWYKADHPHTKPAADDLPAEASQKQHELRKCKHCGNLFEPSHGGKQYCSESCKHIHSAQLNLEARRRAIANLPEKKLRILRKDIPPE